MTEILVLLACATNNGCSPSVNAYYAENPKVREVTRYHTKRVKTMIGPTAVTFAPLVLLTAKGKASINLGHNIALQFSNRDSSALIIYNFSF